MQKFFQCKVMKLGRDDSNARVISELDLLAADNALTFFSEVVNNIENKELRAVMQTRLKSLAGSFIFLEKLMKAKMNGGIISDGLFFGSLEPNEAFVNLFYPGLDLKNIKPDESKSLTNVESANKVPA